MTTSRPTRALALVALLFVAGLQLAETGHDHSADHSLTQCLLCKLSVDAVVPVAAAGLPATPADKWGRQTLSAPPCTGDEPPFEARGPPLYS